MSSTRKFQFGNKLIPKDILEDGNVNTLPYKHICSLERKFNIIQVHTYKIKNQFLSQNETISIFCIIVVAQQYAQIKCRGLKLWRRKGEYFLWFSSQPHFMAGRFDFLQNPQKMVWKADNIIWIFTFGHQH